jgi:hypothetical protein
MILFWLGFMTCAWLVTVIGVGYTIWRYVYCPWTASRRDIVGLNDLYKKLDAKVDEALKSIQTRQFEQMSDPELAAVETRLRQRSLGRIGR